MSAISVSFDSLLANRKDLQAYATDCKNSATKRVSVIELGENTLYTASYVTSIARAVGDAAKTVFEATPPQALHATNVLGALEFPFYVRDVGKDIYGLATAKDSEEAIDSTLHAAYATSNLVDAAVRVMNFAIHFGKLTGRIVTVTGVLGHVSTVLSLALLVIDIRKLHKCAQAISHLDQVNDNVAQKTLKERVYIGIGSISLSMLATTVGIVGTAILLFTPFAVVGIVLVGVATAGALACLLIDWGADIHMNRQFAAAAAA